MVTLPALVAVVTLAAVLPTLSDVAAVRSRHTLLLTEASGPSPGSHDTALAENESNGASPGGRDTAQV